MIAMRLPFALLLGLLLLVAAGADVRARIIPNSLNAAIAVLAVGWWIAWGLSTQDILIQIGLAFAALTIFGGLFALGLMGGGDVKLITALALWLPAGQLLQMLFWMALAGGLLTLAMLAIHAMRRSGERLEVPYGVAIAGATLLVLANDILTSRAA